MANRARKRTRKKTSVVDAAMRSSTEMEVHQLGEKGVEAERGDGLPARPRARRTIWSICWRAAVVAGEVVVAESEMDVAGEGKGRDMCVARNMW